MKLPIGARRVVVKRFAARYGRASKKGPAFGRDKAFLRSAMLEEIKGGRRMEVRTMSKGAKSGSRYRRWPRGFRPLLQQAA